MSYLQLPLKNRTIRSSQPFRVVYCSGEGRPPVYKDYSKENIARACEAVTLGTSVRQAALQFDIPKSTLSDHVTGRVKLGSHSGPPRYLTDAEEEELSSFITLCASIGCAKSKKEIVSVVEAVLQSKGKQINISNGWWESFRRRHPNFTLRTAEKLSYARLVVTNRDIMDKYFDLLERTLVDNKLIDSPAQIFNCDESGLSLDHTPSSVVACKGQKHPRIVTSGNKKQITVLGCANAAGHALPPLVIFSRKALNQKLTIGEVPGTMYGLSDNGWMDSEIFENWFLHHFLLHAPSSRPLLLLLDGHSTHYNPAFINTAAKEGVVVFCLPPYSTHLTQPLDKLFGPLKSYWNQECQHYMTKNPGKVVTQFDFMQVFSRAWYQGMTMPNIISAFKTTGVFPFDRFAIKVVDLPPGSKFDPSALPKKTGLAFIPFYSPMRKPASVAQAPNPVHLSTPDLSTPDPVHLSTPDPVQESPSSLLTAFSEEDHERFNRRFEEGFDIATDHHYNQWLKEYKSSASRASVPPNLLLNSHQSLPVLKKFLPELPPQAINSQKYEKHSGKVLTSVEHRKAMEEKERLKSEKKAGVERRKQEREEKRLEKIKQKEMKQQSKQLRKKKTTKGQSLISVY